MDYVMTVDEKYFIKEYEKSFMFKVPNSEEYKNFFFFYTKEHCKKSEKGYDLYASDTFVVYLKNNKKEEKAISMQTLMELYGISNELYASTWSIDKSENGVCFFIGNENEEYIIGEQDAFEEKDGTFILKNAEKITLCRNLPEAEFFYNNLCGAKKNELSAQDELQYQKYINAVQDKKAKNFESWFELIATRKEWAEQKENNSALLKIESYKNDREYENTFPLALRARKQFVAWRWEYDEERQMAKKVPMNPWKEGQYASATDWFTWGTFDMCCDFVNNHNYDGVGIILGRGIIGIDFDHCIVDGVCNQEKSEWIDKINSYTEVSPSGDGIHIIAFGNLPEGSGKRNDAVGVECYDNARFFTLTGKLYDGKFRSIKSASASKNAINELSETYLKKKVAVRKAEILAETTVGASKYAVGPTVYDDELVVAKIRQSARGIAFSSLFDNKEVPVGRDGLYNLHCMRLKNANEEIKEQLKSNAIIEKYYELDNSACDTFLCGIIASYTNSPEQIDRIYRQSALMRGKWDSLRGGTSYGNLVCDKVLETCGWKYNWGKSSDTNENNIIYSGRKGKQMKISDKFFAKKNNVDVME